MRVVRVKSKAMQIYALFSRFCSLFPIRLGRHLDSLDREETGIECSRECSFFHGKSATALRHLTKVLVCDPSTPQAFCTPYLLRCIQGPFFFTKHKTRGRNIKSCPIYEVPRHFDRWRTLHVSREAQHGAFAVVAVTSGRFRLNPSGGYGKKQVWIREKIRASWQLLVKLLDCCSNRRKRVSSVSVINWNQCTGQYIDPQSIRVPV